MNCSIESCLSRVFTHGMCSKHWQRMKRNGDAHALFGRSGKPQFTMPAVELKRLYDEADSISDLARQLGVRQGTVNYRLRQLGIPIRDRGWHSPKSTPPRKMEDSPHWRGGKHTNPKGYVLMYAPNHPTHNGKGYVAEHRLVMEKMIGRLLLRTEHVHHLNGIRDDNQPENLELWQRKDPPGVRPSQNQHCPTCTCFH